MSTTDTLPPALTRLPQWVTWVSESRNGKPTKVPYVAHSGKRASSVDRAHWCDHATALADRTKTGIGFVFSDDDPFVGIDLDDCLTEDGTLSEWAGRILDGLPATYTEVSPSGKGLKLWVMGELPRGSRNRRAMEDGGGIEIYARGRFFTVTGTRYADAPLTIAHADLAPLHARLFPSSKPGVMIEPEGNGGGFGGSNDSMIAAIQRSKQAKRFKQLWDGDLSGNNEDHSSADQSLCNILAFWCGPNEKRIDRVFRGSGLYRDKWDRDDYRASTIGSAIERCTSFYQPADSVIVNHDSAVFTRAADGKVYPMTDLGNAERLVSHFQGRIRFCESGGGWYVWDGRRWRKDDTGCITYFCTRSIREIWREAETLKIDDAEKLQNTRESLYKHATKSESQPRIKAAIVLASSMPGVSIVSADFDADPWLFNCKNGTIDLRNGKLRDHNSGDNITKISPASYHPTAIANKWEAFLARIFHDNVELVDYVQEVCGLCLSGDISEQIMPVFFGDGSNGKSTLLDTVMDVMGGYAGKAAPDLLMARNNDVHPTEIANLWGLRLAVASETEEGRKLRISMVKEMTGDAELKARFMGRDFFDFRRTHKLILMTNHKPRVSEGKHAIWRRLKLVPFAAEITAEEMDKQLGDKLRGEWTGILAWLVRGCMRWHASGGLDDPAEVREATLAYKDEEDPLAEFVAERLRYDAEAFTSNADLRRAYSQWCSSASIQKPLGERALLSRLAEDKRLSRDVRRSGGGTPRGLAGVALAGISSATAQPPTGKEVS